MIVSQRRQDRVRRALGDRLGSVVVVVESVRRRHNTSAILRSAEAMGVHEVHLVTGDFKPSKGAARGAERWLELRRFARVADSLSDLRERGFRVVVADLDPSAVSAAEVSVDQPIAVVFGAELTGVSEEARALSDGAVIVPMRGLTESLNVAAAATVVVHHIAERRRAMLGGGDLDHERQEAFFSDWLVREKEAYLGRHARVT